MRRYFHISAAMIVAMGVLLSGAAAGWSRGSGEAPAVAVKAAEKKPLKVGWFVAVFMPALVTYDLQARNMVSPTSDAEDANWHYENKISEQAAGKLQKLVTDSDLRSFEPSLDLFSDKYQAEGLSAAGIFVVWEDQTRVWWLPVDPRVLPCPPTAESEEEASAAEREKDLKDDVPLAVLRNYRALWALFRAMQSTDGPLGPPKVRHTAEDMRTNPFLDERWLVTAVKAALPHQAHKYWDEAESVP